MKKRNYVMMAGLWLVALLACLTLAACGDEQGASSGLPKFSGLDEVKVESSLSNALTKAINIPDAATQLYSTNDDTAKIAGNMNTALTGAGYKFSMPNLTAPQVTGDSAVGLYSKDGKDVMFSVVKLPEDISTITKSGMDGVSEDAKKKFAEQFKGKKYMVMVVSGAGLLDKLMKK
jgi:hypothetical protein